MRAPRLLFAGRLMSLPIVLAVLAASAYSQTRALKIDDLAKRAELVAVGRVSEMVSEWSADRTHILTRVTLSVQEYVKGEGASTLTITTLGGEVGEVGELYTHVPTFRQNETVVVFLEQSAQGSYRVSGGTQGKYNVEPDPVSGVPLVAGKDRLQDFTSMVRAASQR